MKNENDPTLAHFVTDFFFVCIRQSVDRCYHGSFLLSGFECPKRLTTPHCDSTRLFHVQFIYLWNATWQVGEGIETVLLSFAVGGMSRPPKPVPQVKKVAPPAVPDVFRHSGSSFGSAGYSSSEDGCFISGPETQPSRGKPLGG
jgi:hypothetical protein